MGQHQKQILVVEDHPIFRLGLREFINQEDDLTVCGEASDAAQAKAEIRRLSPDLVIADITLHQSDGIELVREIARDHKDLPVLVLSMHDEYLYAERALQAGACGYIMKQEAMEVVVTAIRQVLDGRIYLAERVKEHLLRNLAGDPRGRGTSPIQRLTSRELEVFGLIGQGLSTREIAERLHLSVKTVGTHRERIKSKLNLRSAAELLRHAVHYTKNGRLEPPR